MKKIHTLFKNAYSPIFCVLGFHSFIYTQERIKGVSQFGETYDLHEIRKCSNCKKKQIEIRHKLWETIG